MNLCHTLTLFLVMVAAPAIAVPESVSFVGRLSTAEGFVDGDATISFTVYDSEINGNPWWTDELDTVANRGLVNVILGTPGNPLDDMVFDGGPAFLEIEVNGEVLQPRLPIHSVPYAIRATEADNAELLGGTVAASDVVTEVLADPGIAVSRSDGEIRVGVDDTTVQSRVSASCAVGSSIREIAQDGTVICENSGGIDTITILTSGPAITAGSFGSGVVNCPSSHPIVVSCGIDLSNVLTMAVTAVAPRISGLRAFLNSDGTYTTQPNGCQVTARNDGTGTQNPGFKMTTTCRQ